MDYSFEKTLIPDGVNIVCGLDEAGRGPLAGPVYAGAVILPEGYLPEGLNDSKKISESKRNKLYDIITENAISFSVCHATVEEINNTDILSAALLAMRRAIASLDVTPDFALIDGNVSRGFTLPVKTVIHGDAISPSIAAASILAKVTRDRICLELDAMYPEYGIAKHKGYATKDHMDALRKYGVAPIYRTKFIRFLDKETN